MFGAKSSYASHLDVVAHEFTHGVVRSTAAFGDSLEAKTLNEAYADILGECVEESLNDFSYEADWIIGGNVRNLLNPNSIKDPKSKKKCPATMEEYITKNSDEHSNATIIGHAAWLMLNGGNTQGEWAQISDKTLAKLWYNSLLLMHSDATFSQCRNAVELSARIMMANKQLTSEQYETVVNAFEAVEINNAPYQYTEYVKNKFDLVVTNAHSNKNTTCRLIISKISDTPSGSVYTTVINDVINGNKNVNLGNGIYMVIVSENGKSPVSVKIVVSSYEPNATDKVEIHTDFSETIPVVLNSDKPTSEPTKVDSSENGAMRLYQPVIEAYQSFVDGSYQSFKKSGNADIDDHIQYIIDEENLNYIEIRSYGGWFSTQSPTTKYSYYDIDKNGSEELILNVNMRLWSHGNHNCGDIYYIYTVHNSKLTFVLDSYTLTFYGKQSAVSSYFSSFWEAAGQYTYYCLKEGAFAVSEILFFSDQIYGINRDNVSAGEYEKAKEKYGTPVTLVFTEIKPTTQSSTTTKPRTTTTTQPTTVSNRYRVVTEEKMNLNIRKKPDATAKILGVIPVDTVVTVEEISDGWGKVTYNGITGWSSMEFLEPEF